MQRMLEIDDPFDVDIIDITLVHGKQGDGHLGDGQRAVLLLLHQFGNALAALQLLAGGFVEIGGKLREGRQFPVLRQRQAHTAAELLDDLGLGRTADARHRQTGVDSRTDTGVEQVGFQKDLPVGDRDHVGGHEGGYVTGLRFDDRQRGQGTGFALHLAVGDPFHFMGVDARGALQQA